MGKQSTRPETTENHQRQTYSVKFGLDQSNAKYQQRSVVPRERLCFRGGGAKFLIKVEDAITVTVGGIEQMHFSWLD